MDLGSILPEEEEAGFDWGLMVGSGAASAFVVGAASLLFRCVRYKGESLYDFFCYFFSFFVLCILFA